MRKKSRAIVAEGYMDVLQLWNYGFTESVACLGTALTLPQLRQISNSTSTVYLLFDGDKAGEGATLRTVTHALEVPNLHVKVVRLPEKEDPDTYLRENGPDALRSSWTRQPICLRSLSTTNSPTHTDSPYLKWSERKFHHGSDPSKIR